MNQEEWEDNCGHWWISGVGAKDGLVAFQITNRKTGDTITWLQEPERCEDMAAGILEAAEMAKGQG